MATGHWRQAEGDEADGDWDDGVEPALTRSVRVPADEQLAQQSEAGREDDEPGDGIQFKRIPALKNAGEEKLDAVVGAGAAEIGERK